MLVAGAAVLGLVAGTCAGYLVQADREPTKLPSLAQPMLPQAKGVAPEPLSAARDRKVRTDGDLRKLLLKRPRGAKEIDWLEGRDGWMDLAMYADSFDRPDEMFDHLIGTEFRRAAVTVWKDDTYTVDIRLIQYRQEETLAAAASVHNMQSQADDEATRSWPVAGTGSGMAYVYDSPQTGVGSLRLYSAEALAVRGDIATQVLVVGTKRVSKEKILDLAERQMERL